MATPDIKLSMIYKILDPVVQTLLFISLTSGKKTQRHVWFLKDVCKSGERILKLFDKRLRLRIYN